MEAERPRVVVGVIVWRKGGDIFLCRSHKWGDKWVVPGGHIEFGERMEDAVVREIKEETGMEVNNVQFVHIDEGIFPPEFHQKRHFIYLHFAAFTDNDAVELNDEAQEYAWTTPAQALQMDLVPSVRPFIEAFVTKVSAAP